MTSNLSEMRAVILAGGRGTRLAPFTAVLPKPLVPLGDMPVLEVLLRRLAHFGIRRATLAVNHLASLIEAYFGDGRKFGIDIDYVVEDSPLGTAGPLAGISGLDDRFFVMNGDLVTDIDFAAFAAAHAAGGGAATVGLYRREIKLDFGIVEIDDERRVVNYREKPTQTHYISMGAYVLEPSVLKYVSRNTPLDLPDLVHAMIRAKERVCTYVHEGYWLDIGRPEDYGRAQEDFLNMRSRLFGP